MLFYYSSLISKDTKHFILLFFFIYIYLKNRPKQNKPMEFFFLLCLVAAVVVVIMIWFVLKDIPVLKWVISGCIVIAGTFFISMAV